MGLGGPQRQMTATRVADDHDLAQVEPQLRLGVVEGSQTIQPRADVLQGAGVARALVRTLAARLALPADPSVLQVPYRPALGRQSSGH